MKSYEGILAVHKPAGFTSHDVVAKTRGILKMKRIGHTGTLDPAVTGVLPLCLGRATRMVEYLQELPKEYVATLVLGIATDTEDLSGHVIENRDGLTISEQEARDVLGRFVGTISQVPPMYSAVKHNGKRLYELAREGKTVERKERKVTILELELLSLGTQDGKPTIKFRVLCSKGTYIRTLCVDIGRALGVPAAMAELTRTVSAGISLDRCLTLDEIAQYAESGALSEYLIPVDEAVSFLSAHRIPADKAKAALQGQRISAKATEPAVKRGENIRLYSEEGQFLGIFRLDELTGAVVPVKVFMPE